MSYKLKTGDVLLFKGTSWISKTIGHITRSPYSHAACYVGDGYIIESDWRGVEFSKLTLKYNHTSYDIYRHRSADSQALNEAVTWMGKQVGKGYDYKGLVGILLAMVGKKKINYTDVQERFWCSELVLDGYHHAGIYTGFDINTYTVSPGDIAESLAFQRIDRRE
jgi:uncharacterized protein YycO